MNTIVSAAPAAKAFVSELTPVPLQPPARCTPQTLLALDLGKFKSVACVMTVATGEHRFVAIESTPSAVHDLLVELMPDRLVIEACSISGWVCDVARTLNVPVEVANTQGDAWNWRRVPRLLRRVLVQAAWGMQRKDGRGKIVFERLCHGQKNRRKQAVVALARKIWVWLWAMLRDGTTWDESKLGAVGTT